MRRKKKYLGVHLLLDFKRCDPRFLNDPRGLLKILVEAAEAAGATVVKKFRHQFTPYGASAVVIIEESHLSIHTWPEHRQALADIFICGGGKSPMRGARYLNKALGAKEMKIVCCLRGEVGHEEANVSPA